MLDEQKLIDTIRSIVRQEIRNGARLHYVDGYVHDASSYVISAYLNGDETNLVENIIPMTGAYLGAGDYIQVAVNDAGWTWVSRIKETPLYSKLQVDANNGRLLFGYGAESPYLPWNYFYGGWTPTLTFATPGDLSVSYAIRTGWYLKQGILMNIGFRIQTSSFTHATASGNLKVTGLPFVPASTTHVNGHGAVGMRGYTKTNFTQITSFVAPSDSSVYFEASGSGQAMTLLVATDVPTVGPVDILCNMTYLAST